MSSIVEFNHYFCVNFVFVINRLPDVNITNVQIFASSLRAMNSVHCISYDTQITISYDTQITISYDT